MRPAVVLVAATLFFAGCTSSSSQGDNPGAGGAQVHTEHGASVSMRPRPLLKVPKLGTFAWSCRGVFRSPRFSVDFTNTGLATERVAYQVGSRRLEPVTLNPGKTVSSAKVREEMRWDIEQSTEPRTIIARVEIEPPARCSPRSPPRVTHSVHVHPH